MTDRFCFVARIVNVCKSILGKVLQILLLLKYIHDFNTKTICVQLFFYCDLLDLEINSLRVFDVRRNILSVSYFYECF